MNITLDYSSLLELEEPDLFIKSEYSNEDVAITEKLISSGRLSHRLKLISVCDCCLYWVSADSWHRSLESLRCVVEIETTKRLRKPFNIIVLDEYVEHGTGPCADAKDNPLATNKDAHTPAASALSCFLAGKEIKWAPARTAVFDANSDPTMGSVSVQSVMHCLAIKDTDRPNELVILIADTINACYQVPKEGVFYMRQSRE